MKREPNTIYFSELPCDVAVDIIDGLIQQADLALALARLSPTEQFFLTLFAEMDEDLPKFARRCGMKDEEAEAFLTKIILKARGETQ